MNPVTLTRHAELRCAQRNLAPVQVEYILAHGQEIRRTGARFYLLRRRDLPLDDRRRPEISRAVGTVLLVSNDGALLTAYRDQGAAHRIAKKCKYRLPRSQRES